MNEDILKKALEQTLDESYNDLIDQDIPDYDFSPEFKAKMDGLILSQQTQPEKKRSKMLWFTAMAAAAAILAVAVGVNTSSRPSRTHKPSTDIISETTVSSSADTTDAKGTTGTSAAVTDAHTTASAVRTEKAVYGNTTSAETSSVQKVTSVTGISQQTTAPAETTSVRSTSSAKTDKPSADTTAASSAVTVTSVSVTVTDITTATGIPDKPHERSISMKKISAFLTAVMAANSSVPPIIPDETDIPRSPLMYVRKYDYIDKDVCDRFFDYRKDESILDFDKDGSFTVKDVYTFSRFVNSPEQVKEDYYTEFDTDGYGKANTSKDLEALIYYFATYYTVTEDMLEPEYYFDTAAAIQSDKYNTEDENYFNSNTFTAELIRCSNNIFQLYDIFKNIASEKNVSFDADGNGTEDFGDIIDFAFFGKGDHYGADIEDYSAFQYTSLISEETYANCAAIYKEFAINEDFPLAERISEYALLYYIDKHGFSPDFTSSNYLTYLRSYGGGCPIRDRITSYQEYLGLRSGDLRYSCMSVEDHDKVLEQNYIDLCDRVDAGKFIVPDLNSDGLLDAGDMRLAELFFDEYRYDENIPLPLEYREKFLTELDLNNNGVYGDVDDVTLYMTYISDLNGFDEEYCIDEIVQYYYDHPDFDPEHAGAYTSLFYNIKPANYPRYLKQIEEGTNKEPDINRDGKIDIADFALAEAIQDNKSNGYARRISVIPDDVREYYLNECDFDKDGHCATYTDLKLVEKYVAEKLGLDINMNETDLYNQLYMLSEEYFSQFDDQLPEDEQTIKASFKPELIKDYAFAQLDILNWDTDGIEYVSEHSSDIKKNITDEQKKIIDINLNGEVDSQDYVLAVALRDNYFKDRCIQHDDEKLLTQEIKDNFYSTFDLNGNGVYGDEADVQWAELICQKVLGISNVENDYREKAYAEKQREREEWMNLSWEERTAKRQEFAEQYRKDIKSDKKAAPDLNEDGKVDIIDYAAATPAAHSRVIFQYEYELIKKAHLLTDEQVDRFFELYDLNNDGEYGTLEDLYIMEIYIQEELGLSNLELFAEVNEFLKQYKDITEHYFDTSTFKPELTKDMSLLEKYSIVHCEQDYYLYEKYAKELDLSTIAQFDLNMNGILEPQDYAIAEYLNENYYTDNHYYPDDKALITDKIKDNFYKNFDPDKNGICGSAGDMELIRNYLNSFSEDGSFISDYRNGYTTNSGIPLEKIEAAMLSDAVADGKITAEEAVEISERNGDANVDKNVNLADSIAILQSYINPDKYALTDEGAYNADISDTGDGITPKDAQQIQKMLLHIK